MRKKKLQYTVEALLHYSETQQQLYSSAHFYSYNGLVMQF